MVVSLFTPSAHPIAEAIQRIRNNMRRMTCGYTLGNCSFPRAQQTQPPQTVPTRCAAGVGQTTSQVSMIPKPFPAQGRTLAWYPVFWQGLPRSSFGGLADDQRQVLCNTRLIQPGGLVNQFGCDTLTKQCEMQGGEEGATVLHNP